MYKCKCGNEIADGAYYTWLDGYCPKCGEPLKPEDLTPEEKVRQAELDVIHAAKLVAGSEGDGNMSNLYTALTYLDHAKKLADEEG